MPRIPSEVDSKLACLAPPNARLVRFETTWRSTDAPDPERQWVLDFVPVAPGTDLEQLRRDALARVDRALWAHTAFEADLRRDTFTCGPWKLRLGILVSSVNRELKHVLRLHLAGADADDGAWPKLLNVTERWAKVVTRWGAASQVSKEILYRDEGTVVHETWMAPLRLVAPVFLYIGGFRKKKNGRSWRREMSRGKRSRRPAPNGSLVVRVSNGNAILVGVSQAPAEV